MKTIFLILLQGEKKGEAVHCVYNDMETFETMLPRFRKWEREEKVAILDVRDSTPEDKKAYLKTQS